MANSPYLPSTYGAAATPAVALPSRPPATLPGGLMGAATRLPRPSLPPAPAPVTSQLAGSGLPKLRTR